MMNVREWKLKKKANRDEEELMELNKEQGDLEEYKVTPFGIRYRFNISGAKTYVIDSHERRGSFL